MILEVKGLNKSFDEAPVLRGIDLQVEKGDVVAILGPSGSGKTTLLRCINFLEAADEGEMIFGGEHFYMGHMRRRDVHRLHRKTAFVFQNYNLFLNKTVLHNVTEGLVTARKMRRDQAEEKAMAALRRVGMADRVDAFPSQLSGGQQQRVAIARGLATDPEIIFFDEPTSALDPEMIGEVLSVMRSLAEDGMTMLVVTHEINFAKNVSNKVLFMEDGTVVERGPSDRFFTSPEHERSRLFVQSILSGREG